MTCNNCNQLYIGTTTRFLHNHILEHLNNENSFVKKHISHTKAKTIKALKSRPSHKKTTVHIYDYLKYFT